MSELIEILTPDVDACSSFVVDTSGPLFVNVTNGNISTAIFKNANGYATFPAGENFYLMSAGFCLSENFSLSNMENVSPKRAPLLILTYNDAVHTPSVLQIFGNDTGFQIPLANFEMPIGVYFDQTSTFETAPYQIPYKIYGGIVAVSSQHIRVSMVNVPSSLHGSTQYIIPFIKILHTARLTA